MKKYRFYIPLLINEERKNNNDLLGYNGLFTDNENGFCSLYEFIYTYRKENSTIFPEIKSKETINAIEMIKKMKDEISSGIEIYFH
ncbi:hypothetical protein PIROE2DRAFT_2149 [Piromyces sp. E2]|nr:hypothetical protein PIROE2DRAFT_2149 [Piromyces sp. E2]|eukprot:OUM69945.1 hypothetical protein PIROE2DRAFT_2149 [Piromyces sp. E2]